MTEATTDPAVKTTETAGEPTAPLVDAKGELKEGWRDTLPEDIKAEKVFDRVSNFEGIMKSLASAERMVGKDKIAIPNETSTDADWEQFHRAGGRPETPQDYNLTVPEDFPEGVYTKERMEETQNFFHKLGLSSKQAAAIMEYDQNIARGFLQAHEQQIQMDREESKNKLFVLWGNAYEQRIHFGNVTVNEGCAGNEELKSNVVEKFGDDPDFIQFTSNLGAKFTERGAIQAANIPTPGDIQKQIDEAMNTEAYKNGKHPGHKQQVEYVAKLFRDKSAMTKTG